VTEIDGTNSMIGMPMKDGHWVLILISRLP